MVRVMVRVRVSIRVKVRGRRLMRAARIALGDRTL